MSLRLVQFETTGSWRTPAKSYGSAEALKEMLPPGKSVAVMSFDSKEYYFWSEKQRRLNRHFSLDDLFTDARTWLAKQTDDPGLLVVLANEESWRVKCEVAQNMSTPMDTFLSMAKDKESGVRIAFATAKRAPLSVLLDMMKVEKNGFVRDAILRTETHKKHRKETLG